MKTTKVLYFSSVIIFVLITFSLCSNQTTKESLQENNKVNEPKNTGKVKNIILLIGDGMGIAQVTAAYTSNLKPLNMERCTVVGLHKTSSSDQYVTDSGAGGTALATGSKTKNGYIGVSSDKQPLKTILEYAEENGLSTGLVATSSITHATPASFIAHVPDRNNYDLIALDFLKTDVDVFIGGGEKFFNKRADNKDLVAQLITKNYQVVKTLEDLKNIKSGKIAALLAQEHMPTIAAQRGDMLSVSTQKALEILSQNEKGFFVMIEGSQIDWANHKNDYKYMVEETLDFDKAVGVAMDFADKDGNTLVIVTADHESGGLTLLGGNLKTGETKANFSTINHSATMVGVFAYGKGAELFGGIYENTEVFVRMKKSFGF